MTTYHYECMDATGSEVNGFMDAKSEDEVQASLREQGYFVTKIGPFLSETTPEWSAVSLGSPSSIPNGRLLAQGFPCAHEQRGMTIEGSANLLGVNGELHLIVDTPGGGGPTLELPIQTIKKVKRRRLFRKSLLVTTNTFEEHVFHGSVSEIQHLYEWAIFATEKAVEADRWTLKKPVPCRPTATELRHDTTIPADGCRSLFLAGVGYFG